MLTVIPAIDILDGKVVRLLGGNYQQKTVYSRQPLEVAKRFREAGIEWVHVINLSGAKEGGVDNIIDVVKEICSFGLKTEVGGGVRSLKDIEKLLSCGAKRVIIGTKALTDWQFLAEAVRQFGPETIVVGLDIANGVPMISGWLMESAFTWEEAISEIDSKGAKWILCTDISRDGRLTGVNVEWYSQLARHFSGNIIASGGVKSLDDIYALDKLSKDFRNLKAVVVGKAIYEGKIRLEDLKSVSEP